jgi:hypothetical protein
VSGELTEFIEFVEFIEFIEFVEFIEFIEFVEQVCVETITILRTHKCSRCALIGGRNEPPRQPKRLPPLLI